MNSTSAAFLGGALALVALGLGAAIGLLLRFAGRPTNRIARERLNLALLERLGSDSSRVQLAAAAMLLERLRELAHSRKPADTVEKQSLAASLLAILKDRQPPASTLAPETGTIRGAASSTAPYSSLVLHKLIAETIVTVLGARLDEATSPKGDTSPLAGYDLQRIRVEDVNWRHLDARGIDFYGANLRGCTLRNALLNRAVLYECDLTNAILRGADLRDTNLSGTILTGAKYDSGTRWPDGFDPRAAGAIQAS